MAVPNIFGSATAAIPLSQLDTNFATPVTIGNTAVQLGNTVTSFGNVTLTNVTISSGNVTLTGANVSGTANVSTLVVTGNATIAGTATTIQGLTVGRGAGAVSTNTAVGASALAANTTGSNSVAFGSSALTLAQDAINNTAVGANALAATVSGGRNTAVGLSALSANTVSYNTAVGASAMQVSTTGEYNAALGRSALGANTTGGSNTALGALALQANTTASNNTAVGYQAGYNFTTSNDNTALGYQAGKGGATGQTGIVCLGAYAGSYQRTATGSGVILIGAQADVASAANSFEIVIGYNTTGKGASTGFINPNSGGVYQGNNGATWSVTSDQRLKKNIVDNTVGLDAITSIRVRNFEYRLPEEVDAELKPTDAIKKSGVQLGVIAQELNEVLPDCIKTESTGVMSVNSDNLTWYLVNAIKELKAEIDALKGASA